MKFVGIYQLEIFLRNTGSEFWGLNFNHGISIDQKIFPIILQFFGPFTF